MPDPTLGLDNVNPDPAAKPPTPRPRTFDLSKPIITLPNGVTVRHYRHSDAETIVKHADNQKILRNMTNRWPDPYSVDKSHAWIVRCRDEENWVATGPTDPASKNTKGLGQKLPHAWAICVNDEPVGGIGAEFGSDVRSRVTQFGYWLGEEFWGKGIMTEVVKAFTAFLWDNYPWVIKLEAGCYGWNMGSGRVLEKAGFQFEGRSRCSVEKNGVIGDQVNYGMVRPGIVGSEVPPPAE